MANMVFNDRRDGRDVQDARLFHFLCGQFTKLIISNDVCVNSNFADSDIVMKSSVHLEI